MTYTDVEVRTRLTGVDGLTESQLAAFWERLSEDIDGAFNRPLDGAHRLPNGDVLHVTPVRVLDEGGEADWEPVVYRLVPGVEPKDQPVKPSQFHLPFELIAGRGLGAHEFGHQIGWPDEHVEEGADPELALDVLGSLMGRFTCSFDKDVKAAYPEEVAGLEPAGVRDRNLLMLGSTIFDSKSDVITAGDGTELTPTPQPVAARPRVGRVPMAPDDAHDAYDTQG
ncbi:hypothetical protein NMG29_40400, partial [Streptomyces cocklensis]|uniref:hypothetical protein n=1 Tax=Actinacidiphila cocklensis TaxID=887465 RepID=UPI00203B851D